MDVVQICSNYLTDKRFCTAIVDIYCDCDYSSQNNLYKIIRLLYDKDASDPITHQFPDHHIILEPIINNLYLHTEWYYKDSIEYKEKETTLFDREEKTPLHELLKSIKNFVTMTPRYYRPSIVNLEYDGYNININKYNSVILDIQSFSEKKKELYENDIYYIYRGLFYLFIHINSSHPDFPAVADLLFYLCIKSQDITVMYLHQLITHWPYIVSEICTYLGITCRVINVVDPNYSEKIQKDVVY